MTSFLDRVDPKRKPRNGTATATPYGLKALQDECRTVAATPEGTRNDRLNTAALKIGQLVSGGQLPEDMAVDQLTEAARACGLDESEIGPTIRSGLNAGRREPRAPAAKQPGRSRPRLADHLLSREDLRNLPEPEPLIDNVLDRGTTALLYGMWGTAKSFIALDWAACVATGKPWQGREAGPGRVLYVAAEGANGHRGRADAWEAGWQRDIGDSMTWLKLPVNLMKADEVAELAELITHGEYDFIVLDTLARCMVGADENSAKDCGVVVDAMTQLLHATPGGRGVVLGVHHTGKDAKTFRGSSAFEAGADTVYFSSRDGETITLAREKRKDGPEADHHLLKVEEIRGTGSGVVSACSGETVAPRTDTLRSIMSQSLVSTGVSGSELRKMVVDAGVMSRASYYRAINDLLQSGEIINTGSDARPFYKWASQSHG